MVQHHDSRQAMLSDGRDMNSTGGSEGWTDRLILGE